MEKRLSIRLPADLLKQARAIATSQMVSVAAVIRRAVADYLAAQRKVA